MDALIREPGKIVLRAVRHQRNSDTPELADLVWWV